MGREAVIRAEVADRSATVTALLESTELILRAPIGRRFARAGITDVVVDGEALRLRCGSDLVVLHLGERAARSWATAITTPPPSLREKLGLAGSARAMLVGEADDPDLAAALQDSLTLERDAADMIVARVSSPDDVREALAVLEAGAAVPVWAVYAKGRNTAFGDAAVRELLRGAGLRDTKTCAVSAALTATRYHPPRA